MNILYTIGMLGMRKIPTDENTVDKNPDKKVSNKKVFRVVIYS